MSTLNNVLEFMYPSDNYAVDLAVSLFDYDLKPWGPFCNNGKKAIIAGGSNDFHHKLIDILSMTSRDHPVTLLVLDQHIDRAYEQAAPLFGMPLIAPILYVHYANFMDKVEKLPNIEQIIYLGMARTMPSTHEYAIDKYYLTNAMKDLFIYVAEEQIKERPDFEAVTPEMLEDPLFAHFIDVLKKEWEKPTIEHGVTKLFLDSFYYPARKAALKAIKGNETVKSYEQNIDQVRIIWKNVNEFDPSVIRNKNLWISLDFDIFDKSAGIPTKQSFGKVPYKWFNWFLDKLDSFEIDGVDYWGYEGDKDGYKPIPRIREIHNTLKEGMQ